MKLIFIRHAEPDYAVDSLTEKGFREAGLLAERSAEWKVTDVYCSPLGRAQATSKPSLKEWGKEAVTYEWLREFHAPVINPDKPEEWRIPWDFRPGYLNENPVLFSPEHWWEAPVMQTGNVKESYDWVCNGLDGVLSKYGYERNGLVYSSPKEVLPSNHFMQYNGTTKECLKDSRVDETTLVFFCHLGVMMVMASHLLNTSPVTMWQGMFIPPASVTVFSTEEIKPGEAYFRCQMMGDTSHLRQKGEITSYYGGFTTPFQG